LNNYTDAASVYATGHRPHVFTPDNLMLAGLASIKHWPHRKRVLSLLFVAVLWFLVNTASASERDVHFYAVYAIGLASGLSESDSLLIATASQSLDENAETSPMPDLNTVQSGHYPWYYARATLWHSLPPWWYSEEDLGNPSLFLGSDDERAVQRRLRDEQMVQRRLLELYKRALDVDEKDDYTSKIYFGQYLHALADSITHRGYENLVGHARDWKAPDIPGPERRLQTEQIIRVLVGATADYQRRRLHEKPRVVAKSTLNMIENALTYAAPSGTETVETRQEVVRQELERSFRNPNIAQSIPKWTVKEGDGGVAPIPFDVDGKVKTDGKVIDPTHWGDVLEGVTITASRQAAADVKAELGPFGLSNVSLGGIDLSSVTLKYVADIPSPTGGRTFLASLEPTRPGEGVPASVSLLAFATTLIVPDGAWWVNLNPDEPDRITDPNLGRTDIGRILLEADLRLKHLTIKVMDPASASGKAYWQERTNSPFGRKYFSRGDERTWIVPGVCVARTTGSEIEICDCSLDVRTDIKRITVFDEENGEVGNRAIVQQGLELKRHLNDKYILPALRKAINQDAQFAELRAIYKARALALAYKQRFSQTGSLSDVIDSINLKLLPPASKRAPKTIWAEYAAEYRAAATQYSIPLGNGSEIIEQSGGIVLDTIHLSEATPTESTIPTPPLSLDNGILVASSRNKPRPFGRMPLLATALQAYQKADASADIASTNQLLYALAMTHDPAYGEVRRTAARGVDVDITDALQSPTADAASKNPLAYAVWTRLHPKEARNRAASHPEEIFEVLVYMAAVASAPRADDPDPRVLDIAFSHLLDAFAKSKRGNLSAEFVMADSAASVLVAPRTAPRFCQVLMSPSFRGELYRDPQSVWKVAHAEALFDMKAAADLLLALKTSYYAQQLEPPDFVSANVRELFRLGLDLQKLDESQEPRAKVRAARFEWMHNPSKAIVDVLPVIRSMAPSMTAEDRDELILQALPILASEVPQEAEQFAATIHDPASRSEAYSWLAMFSHNGGAAQMLFSGQLSVEAEPFILEQDMVFGKH
jgi:hypothetical protein